MSKVFQFIVILFFIGNSVIANPVEPLIRFTFEPNSSKTLPGNSTEKASDYNCNGVINEEDQLQDFATVIIASQSACYANAEWTNHDFLVEVGVATSLDKKYSYPAVRLHPPARMATQFVATNHVAYYRSSEEIEVFKLTGDEPFKNFRSTKEKSINGFQRIQDLYLDNISQLTVFLMIPAKDNFSAYHKIAKNVMAAQLYSSDNFTVERYRFDVKGAIFDTKTGFNARLTSGEAMYGAARSFFMHKHPKGFAIIWQDNKNDTVYLSIVAKDLQNIETKKLKSLPGFSLAAATLDDKANPYYFLIERSVNYSTMKTRRATAYKTDLNGKEILSKQYDTSEAGFNIANYGAGMGQSQFSSASLVYKNGLLAFMVGRTMHGEHHQSAIIVVLNALDLSIRRNHGQAASHSLGNMIIPSNEDDFLAIDIGDNFPRGISLYRFNAETRDGRLIYSVKTHHAESEREIGGKKTPVYAEISEPNRKFYQWSNDNTPYCELGGINETKDGIAVFFTGEPDDAGKSLNNRRAREVLNDARNLGFIYLKKDFTKPDSILSEGITEKGGFYTFIGTYSEQENKGIKWLTNFHDLNKQNVSRVKTVSLNDQQIFILYENWTKDNHISTQLNIFDPTKESMLVSENIGPYMPFTWRQDLYIEDNQIYVPTGSLVDSKIEINIIKLKNYGEIENNWQEEEARHRKN